MIRSVDRTSSSVAPVAGARVHVPTLRSRRVMRNSDVPISVRIIEQADIKQHRHDFTEIVVVLGGVGDHLLDDDRFPISTGDVLVIDQNHVHGYRNARGLQIANILFDEQFVLDREHSLTHLAGYQALVHLEPGARSRLSFGGKLKLTTENRIMIEERIHELRDELTTRAEGYQALSLSILVDVIVRLCRIYRTSASDTQRNLCDMGYVVGYLEQNYQDRIEIKDLEPLVAMSPRTLMRRFAQATGTTPMQYLLRVRVTRAAHMLCTTQASMTDISAEVGFSDSNYFSRQFRKLIGTSPTEYRHAYTSSHA
ncbi:MAG: helix-turn-helix domain-containing protein [Spirochaetaceae bacterium]|nr:MAG: helix-turn-helix domain-containing protein [Spirochaetaceae bacterium]